MSQIQGVEEYEISSHQWISPEDVFPSNDGDVDDESKSDIVLYCYPHSINCLKVMMALEEKNIAYRAIMVNINLGHQFHDDFLKLNPKAEVPVMRDQRSGKIYVDSDSIISELNKLYLYCVHPRYTELNPPTVQVLVTAHALFLKRFSASRIETLTYGSVMFDINSLGIEPNYPYNYPATREQIKEMVQLRLRTLISEASRLQQTDKCSNTSLSLMRKAVSFRDELPHITIRKKYEEVIAEFESLLDDCEAQLRRTGFGLWFLDSRITQVDISFSILLYRLWQIGFAKRFWHSKKRHYIAQYFEKVKQRQSFRKVTHMEENKIESWPFVTGALVCLFAVTYETLFGN